MEDHYLTCKDLNIHLQLATIYGCRAPILFSGEHLKKIDQKNLPSCNSSAILQVIQILYKLCFYEETIQNSHKHILMYVV